MNIIIDNKGGAPIYEQIYTQIKAQIISGALAENELLPSIRGLAKDLRISFITTKRAYELSATALSTRSRQRAATSRRRTWSSYARRI